MPASVFVDWATAPIKSRVTRVTGVTPNARPSISAPLHLAAKVTRTLEARVTGVITPMPTTITQVTPSADVGLPQKSAGLQCDNPSNPGNLGDREWCEAPAREGIADDDLIEPALFPDGRRLWRFRAGFIPAGAGDGVLALIQEARACRVVLVADGPELIVVEPWLSTFRPEALRSLRDEAGAVIALLRGAFRPRIAQRVENRP